jgi:hypothetical protein
MQIHKHGETLRLYSRRGIDLLRRFRELRGHLVYTATVEAFLLRGAIPDAKDDEGKTPLHLADRYGRTAGECVAAAVPSGAHGKQQDLTPSSRPFALFQSPTSATKSAMIGRVDPKALLQTFKGDAVA